MKQDKEQIQLTSTLPYHLPIDTEEVVEALQDPRVREEYEKLKQIEEDIEEALNEFLLDRPTGVISFNGEVFQPILRDILEEHFPSDIKVEIEVLDEDSRLMGVGVEIPFSKNPKI